VTPLRRGWRRAARWPVRFAVGAWFENVRGLVDRGEMHVIDGGRGGYIGISPIGDGVAGAAAVVRASVFESFRHDASALLLRMIGASADLRARFSSARAATPTRGTGPLAHGASRFGEDRLLIAGDAVAFVDPFTGEGIQAALLSGIMAAEAAESVLRGTAGPATAAVAYQRDLGRTLRPRFAVARTLQALLSSPRLARRVASSLSRREDLAASIIAVTGGCERPGSLLSASFLRPLILESAGLHGTAAPPARSGEAVR
jgi:flavin-dependent dehydrogenase